MRWCWLGRAFNFPLPLAPGSSPGRVSGLGVGNIASMPNWKPRNTARARRLRREATPAERALWEHLSRSQTGVRFSRQMPVGPYFADFLCRELALVVELDGHSHDAAPERDARRDAWLAGHGFAVLRFTNAEVQANIEGVVSAIDEVNGGEVAAGVGHEASQMFSVWSFCDNLCEI